MTHTFTKRSTIATSPEALFAWHERPGAFARLNPPFEPVTVRRATGGIRDGAQVELGVPVGPGPLRRVTFPWRLEHRDYVAGKQFRDVQTSGPFAAWCHTHSIGPSSDGSAILDDTIEYRLPLEPFSGILAGRLVDRKLARLFTYRHTITRNDLALFARYPTPRPLRILVSGASGFVGSELCPLLTVAGHEVTRLVRRNPQGEGEISWDPERGTIDVSRLSGFDAVIHLAGENIAAGRWTAARKRALTTSRVDTTRFLVETLGSTPTPPAAFISASAIGVYGERGTTEVDERSVIGAGFLAHLTREWEESARLADGFGMRAVMLRFGIILSARGGALQRMLPPFLAGVGGRLGHGNHYMSWVALDDALGMIYAALADNAIAGPVNVVAPHPVTNREFTATLAHVLRRPACFPAPAPALRLLLG